MLSRSLDKAKEAYRRRDAEASRGAHSVEPARTSAEEEHRQEQGQYIKSIVYGGLDGIITTFAVVAGVAGADLQLGVVLILGFANLIADGLSMAIGDYLSTKAEREYEHAEQVREVWEVENYPEGEKQEMVELYVGKGMSPQDASSIVEVLARNPKAWVDVMMVEELGIVQSSESPLKNAIATFLSFGLFGFIPLLTYVLARAFPGLPLNTFAVASVLTGVTLFALGSLKVKFTGRSWFGSGLEMFLVGGVAAAAAYAIGRLLAGLA